MKPQGLPLFARVLTPDSLDKGVKGAPSNVPGKGVESPFGAKLASAIGDASKVVAPITLVDSPLKQPSFQEEVVSTMQTCGEIVQTPVNDVPTPRQERTGEPAPAVFVMPRSRRTPVPKAEPERVRDEAAVPAVAVIKHEPAAFLPPAAVAAAPADNQQKLQTLVNPSPMRHSSNAYVAEHERPSVEGTVTESLDAPTATVTKSSSFAPLVDVPAFLLNPPSLYVVPLHLKGERAFVHDASPIETALPTSAFARVSLQSQPTRKAGVIIEPTPVFAKVAETAPPKAVAAPTKPTFRTVAPTSGTTQSIVPPLPKARVATNAAVVAQPTPVFAKAAKTAPAKSVDAPVQFAQPTSRDEVQKVTVANASEVTSLSIATARPTPSEVSTNTAVPVSATTFAVPSVVSQLADAARPLKAGIPGFVKNQIVVAVDSQSRATNVPAERSAGQKQSSFPPLSTSSAHQPTQSEHRPPQSSDGKQERRDYELSRPTAVAVSTANMTPPVQSGSPTPTIAAPTLPPAVLTPSPFTQPQHTHVAEASPVPARTNPLTGSNLLDLSQFGNAKIDLNNNEARVSMETDSGGLSLHVRVRQGVTDVSFEGQAAAQLGAHSRDLEAYLSKEGLTLGHFAIEDRGLCSGESGERDAQGQSSSRQEPDEDVGTGHAETGSERPVSGKPSRVRSSGRVHVKA